MTKNAQTRVEFDEHGNRTTYDEIEVGRDLGSLEWVITEQDIEKQCSIDEDFHPWFAFDIQEDLGASDSQWAGINTVNQGGSCHALTTFGAYSINGISRI